jgi:hypothetical protein
MKNELRDTCLRLLHSLRPREFLIATVGLIGALLGINSALALTITQPTASTVIAAGEDYATQMLGNAWDMSDAADLDTEAEESPGIVSPTFSSGIFSATTSANGAYLYPLFMGYPATVNLSRGAKFPIDTSHYRYASIKIRATQPAAQNQFARFVYLQSGNSYNDATFGTSGYAILLANQWMIIKYDLVTNYDPAHHKWTDFPVQGFRLDPATTNASAAYAAAQFDVDWIRLTAPASTSQLAPVQWTDSGYTGTYNISVVDAAGVSYLLASNLADTSYNADFTFLPPASYTVSVARADASASASSATFRINSPPQIAISQPSVRGEQAQNFAQVVVGNRWGPIDAADFFLVNNFVSSSISYSNPSGTFYARPANNDPGFFFNLGGHPIDTGLYRSLCFTMQDFGVRSIGLGSVARLFWGATANGTNLTTSADIPLYTGANEYCVPDMAAIVIDGTPTGGVWSGSKAALRMDPHEFPVSTACASSPSPVNCHDVRLNSVVLSPFAQANPSYTFSWTLTDTDAISTTLSFYLDPDTTPGNGNEMLIGSMAASNGSSQFVWPGSSAIPYGTYHVLVVADDGINAVSQYAGGMLVVGARDGIFRNGFENTH